MILPAGQADLSDRRLGPVNTNARNITQIAEGLAGSARPDELAELAELLDRAKDFQVQAEALQHKAATLMEVVDQIANSVRYEA